MKRILLKSLMLLVALSGPVFSVARTYCHEELKSGDNSIYLSCEKVSAGNYRMTVEGENLVGLGGTFFNPGTVDIRSTITTNTPTKIVCTIAAESDPQIYTPLYVLMPAEVNFGEIKDIEWSTCGESPVDTKAPVMESASFVSATHNSAIVAVSATPADSIAMYQVMNMDTKLGVFIPKDGQISIIGLTSNTQYTLHVYAIKTTGLVSENYKEVSFTTQDLVYCDFPTGHLGDAAFGDPAGRILLTIAKKSNASVSVTLKTNGDAAIDWYRVEIGGVAKEVGTKNSGNVVTGELVFEGLSSLDFSCNVFWHTPALGDGHWVTNPFDVKASQLCGETTTITNVVVNSSERSRKFICNGQLVILRDGIYYNVLGSQLK